MTLKEKEEKILKHCTGRLCSECALRGNIVECDFEIPENVEKGYTILFPDKTEPNTESPTNVGAEYLKAFGYKTETTNDPVNRPSHYTDGKIEVIEFIEDKNLGFCLGNAVKYIARAGKKDPTKEIEDLNKAKWYIERRIKELEEARA